MEMLIILNVWPHQPWVSMHSFILSGCRIPSEYLRILESNIAIPNSKFIFQNLHLSEFSHMVTIFSWGIQHDSTIFNPFLDILWAFHVGDTLGWPPGPPCPGHRAAHASHRAGADGTCRTLAGGVAAGCFSREGLLGGLKYGYGSIPWNLT